MSIGYQSILKARRVEEDANRMGFRFAHAKHRGFGDMDVIALYPLDDKLPDYSRDAELCVGNLNDIDNFLRGIEWNRNYMKMLKLVTDEKIERKEQDVRNRQLLQLLRAENKDVVPT